MRASARSLVVLVLLVVAPAVAHAQLRLSDCVTAGAPSRCGTLKVPEDPALGSSRLVTLPVIVVLHRSKAPAKDPLFMLKGGPGEAATEDAEDAVQLFRSVLQDHDLVLINQRGASRRWSTCQSAPGAFLVPSHPDECLQRLTAVSDPRMYTTEHFVADLEAARAALGYERINLWGGSYGSRAAYVYAKRYPTRVRSVVLVGPAPLASSVLDNYPANHGRALEAVVTGCRADAACAAAFPTVAANVTALRTDLTSRFEQFGLQALLYSSSTANAVPFIADRFAAGDRTVFDAAIQNVRAGLVARLSVALDLAVFCSEELPYHEPGRADDSSFLRREYEEACQGWPRATLVPDFRTVVRLDMPALVIVGERDPVTPPEWAQLARQQFTRGQVVIVPGEGHLLNRVEACIGSMTRDFIETARADSTCSMVKPLPYRLR